MAYPHSYTNGFVPPPPTGWGQPPFPLPPAYTHQASQQHYTAPPPNGPPLKKQKGNPVITKYPPPPPGWKPPFQATGHQQPAAGYEPHPYAAPTPGHYQTPQPPFQPSTPYVHQSYTPDSNQAYQNDQGHAYQYDPNQAYQQPPYQPGQSYQQYQAPQPYETAQPYLPTQAYAPVLSPTHVAQPQAGFYDVTGAWQTSQPPYATRPPQQAAVPYIDPSTVPAAVSEAGQDHGHLSITEPEDLDQDYCGGVSITDEVDPRFSLGLITWQPATSRKRPLPGTFKEAALEDLAQAKVPQDEEESISKYFVNSKKHEVQLSIKQTDEWEEVKNDLIFVQFVETCEVVPLLTVIENRIRPDPGRAESSDTEQKASSYTVPQKHFSVRTETTQEDLEEDDDGDQAMDMSDDEDEPSQPPLKLGIHSECQSETRQGPTISPVAKHINVLDSLEQALGQSEYPKLNKPCRPPPSARYSRSRSPEKMHRSRQGSQQPRGRPSEHPRDAAQESVLAALGVEGSPKMVFPTPGPALGPPASPDRNGTRSPERLFTRPPFNGTIHHPNIAPYGPNFPPPPPPRDVRSPSIDVWRAHDAIYGDPRHIRSPSASSQRTAAGSDFHADESQDMDATPKAKPPPPPSSYDRYGGPTGSGRKRTYDHITESESDKRRRQPDDTPRARRKPNYDRTDAYSRRW